MAANLSFDYPAILTKAAWDKNKGKIAKLVVGKTDVGAALLTIETEAKKHFGGLKPFAGTDPIEFDRYLTLMEKNLDLGAKAIQAKVTNAGPILKACIADFGASKVVPKSSREYAQKIQAALKPFLSSLETFATRVESELLKDYKAQLAKNSGFLALSGTGAAADKIFANLMANIKKVEAKPSLATFSSVFGQDGPSRQVTTACTLWDQLVPKSFPALAKAIYGGKAMADFAGLPHMMAVANEANGDASKIIQAKIKGGQPEDRAVTTFMLEYSKSCLKARLILDHCKSAWNQLKQYQ